MDDFLKMAQNTVVLSQRKRWFYRKAQHDPAFNWDELRRQWDALSPQHASEDLGELVLLTIKKD